MRRHLVPEPTPTLSVEEAAILSDEMAQAVNAANDCSQEIGRLGDIIVTVGDIETVVSNTPEISQVEQDLIGAVADMAVAGTDADPEDVMATSLDDESRKITTESFIDSVKDKLAKMWEAIKKAFNTAIQHIKKFFSGLEIGTKNSIKKAEHVQQITKELQQHHVTPIKDGHFLFKGQVHRLAYKGKVSTDIDTPLRTLHRDAFKVMDKTIDLLEEMVSSIDSLASKLLQGDPDTAFEPAFLSFFDKVGQVIGVKGGANGKCTYASEEYIGGLKFQLTAHLRADASYGATIKERFTHAVHATFHVIVEESANLSQEVPVLPLAASDAISATALDWLKKYKNNAYPTTIADLEDKIQKVVEKIDRLLDMRSDEDVMDQRHSKDFITPISLAIPFIANITARLLSQVAMKTFNVDDALLAYADQSNQIIAGSDPT